MNHTDRPEVAEVAKIAHPRERMVEEGMGAVELRAAFGLCAVSTIRIPLHAAGILRR